MQGPYRLFSSEKVNGLGEGLGIGEEIGVGNIEVGREVTGIPLYPKKLNISESKLNKKPVIRFITIQDSLAVSFFAKGVSISAGLWLRSA